MSNDCTTSPIYQIKAGSLSAIIANVAYTYSTDPGVNYALFVPSTAPGSILTTFSLSSSGGLVWMNTGFDGGQAQFCSFNNGSIYAVFRGAAPTGCLGVQLTLFSTSSCAGLQLSTITGRKKSYPTYAISVHMLTSAIISDGT